MNIRTIRKIEDQETRKEMTLDYLSKYITDYDVKKWMSGTMTKNLENLLRKAKVEVLNIWDIDQYEIESFC